MANKKPVAAPSEVIVAFKADPELVNLIVEEQLRAAERAGVEEVDRSQLVRQLVREALAARALRFAVPVSPSRMNA